MKIFILKGRNLNLEKLKNTENLANGVCGFEPFCCMINNNAKRNVAQNFIAITAPIC